MEATASEGGAEGSVPAWAAAARLKAKAAREAKPAAEKKNNKEGKMPDKKRGRADSAQVLGQSSSASGADKGRQRRSSGSDVSELPQSVPTGMVSRGRWASGALRGPSPPRLDREQGLFLKAQRLARFAARLKAVLSGAVGRSQSLALCAWRDFDLWVPRDVFGEEVLSSIADSDEELASPA